MTESSHEPIPSMPQKTESPPGLVPRNTQAWVIGGISLLMVVVIALTGRNNPKEHRATPAATAGIDPSALRIEEYKKRIDEEAQKLQMEKTQLARSQTSLASSAPTAAGPTAPLGAYAAAESARYSMQSQLPEDPIGVERRKREYESLFASNVALSYRREPAALPVPPTAPPNSESMAKALAAFGALASSPVDQAKAQEQKPAKREVEKPSRKERDAEIDQADGQRYRLFEGTVLESVLTNRLDGSFSGPVNCMVTTNVYSHNGLHLLIPQGTRALGEVKKIETFGEERLAVAFHRLLMPDGYSVSLDQFRGLNQIGETGLNDQVNHHYLQVFGVSLAIGAIAGLSQANTSYGVNQSAADAYRQGAATSLSQSSLRILDRYLNVLPTVTIREGHRVKIYLSDDLLLPAYDNHRMEDNL
jgi:type IV secretory pathway VirB10-like protein